MADTQKHDYMFLNACDGSDLRGEDTGLGPFDVDGHDLTEEEAKERACELARRLAPLGGFLVGAYRTEEAFVVQCLDGKWVDRYAQPMPIDQLPKSEQRQLADELADDTSSDTHRDVANDPQAANGGRDRVHE